MARNKSKKNSILNFVAVTILTIVGILLCVCSFDIPFTSIHYKGFANAITLSTDLGGGTYAVYECSLTSDSTTTDLDKAIDETVERLKSIVSDRCSEAQVTRQGTNQIRIEVSTDEDSENVLELLGEPTSLTMSLELGGEAWLTGADIKNVVATYQDSTYGVLLVFTDSGAEKFSSLTAAAAEDSGSIYIQYGDGEDDYFTLTVEEEITGGSTFISGSFDTLEEAEDYALQILSGTFTVTMSKVEQATFSATLGENFMTFFLIGCAVAFVLIILLLWLRYGDFAFLAGFAYVIFAVILIFLLQAIPSIQLTLAGLGGIVLGFMMMVFGTVVILEKIREDYRSGKKIPLSVKGGLKNALWTILDSNILIAIVSIVLMIAGGFLIRNFATIFLISIVLALFVNLVVIPFFIKWYLPFNSVKADKLHLPKQVKHVKDGEVVLDGGVTVITDSNIGGQADE